MQFGRVPLTIAIILSAILTRQVFAADIPPLDNVVAKKILGSMGFSAIEVGAVIPDTDGPSRCMVIGVGIQRGETHKIEYRFSYDATRGWFYYEFEMPITDISGQPTALRI